MQKIVDTRKLKPDQRQLPAGHSGFIQIPRANTSCYTPVVIVRAYMRLFSFFNCSIGKVHIFIILICFIFLFEVEKFPSFRGKNEGGTRRKLFKHQKG